jgi:uncharacterized protein YjiK
MVKLISSYLNLLLLTIVICCGTPTDRKPHISDIKNINAAGYDFTVPDELFILPDILREVSGISAIDSSSVACIQDENGIVFIYDIKRKNIQKQLVFHSNGDYEGITLVDNTLYILRSDGVLFEIENFMYPDFKKKMISTGIQEKDNEGLCYDPKNKKLLIASKNNPVRTAEKKENRFIYGFDLISEKIISEPVYKISMSEINRFAGNKKNNDKFKSKKKQKKNDPAIEFKPSAIGIHPLTNKLFVLSGVERMLFIFDNNGNIEFIEKLDPEFFNMPEGITFLMNGDMLISNEGQNRNPTILRFNYK